MIEKGPKGRLDIATYHLDILTYDISPIQTVQFLKVGEGSVAGLGCGQ